jgi:hypothetical protein
MASSGMLRLVALVRTTRRNIPEDAILHIVHIQWQQNLNSDKISLNDGTACSSDCHAVSYRSTHLIIINTVIMQL